MSYSFNIRAASAADAIDAVNHEFDKVVAGQPVHEVDRAQAVANAKAAIDIIAEPLEGEEISVSVNGYVQWRGVMGGEEPVSITGVNISVSAANVIKQAAG